MKVDTQYIISYLENRLTADEQCEFEKQITLSDELRREVDDIAFVHRMTNNLKEQKKIDTARNWDILSKRIKKNQKKAKLIHFFRTTAAVLFIPLLILGGLMFVERLRFYNQDVPQLEISSAFGSVTKTVLPDGTQVWLNSGSKLTYPQRFTDSRSVKLSGEAYFQVVSDKDNRFDVLVSNGLVVSAYGTEFNVTDYEKDSDISVTLAKGNIEVFNTDKAMSEDVNPGQLFKYSKKNKDVVLNEANLDVETAWRNGKTVFRRTKMEDVVLRLSRNFNVDIILKDRELYAYEYSGTFTSQTVEDIMELLSKTAPIKYQIRQPEQYNDYSFSRKEIIISIKR